MKFTYLPVVIDAVQVSNHCDWEDRKFGTLRPFVRVSPLTTGTTPLPEA